MFLRPLPAARSRSSFQLAKFVTADRYGSCFVWKMARRAGRTVHAARLQGPSARLPGWTSTTEEGRAQVGKKYCGIQTNRTFIPQGPEITIVRYAECLTFSKVSTSRVRTCPPLRIIFRLATTLH